MPPKLSLFAPSECAVYSFIASHDGVTAREAARTLNLSKTDINRFLFRSALMRELCFQDRNFRWHALIRQSSVHEGLREFSGWYGTVREFLAQDEANWLSELCEGCRRIGRNLNDTRGLFHSFLDCRSVMLSLFRDLDEMAPSSAFPDWELVFELRLNRAHWIRIYADVLLITPAHVFSLEFKMKNVVDPEEVIQAAGYVPSLEVVFGPRMDIIPALVLTRASDLFTFVPVKGTDAVLPAVSADMLFNVLNEYLSFLT